MITISDSERSRQPRLHSGQWIFEREGTKIEETCLQSEQSPGHELSVYILESVDAITGPLPMFLEITTGIATNSLSTPTSKPFGSVLLLPQACLSYSTVYERLRMETYRQVGAMNESASRDFQ